VDTSIPSPFISVDQRLVSLVPKAALKPIEDGRLIVGSLRSKMWRHEDTPATGNLVDTGVRLLGARFESRHRGGTNRSRDPFL
jgi:hypothetical protein